MKKVAVNILRGLLDGFSIRACARPAGREGGISEVWELHFYPVHWFIWFTGQIEGKDEK
jgi:hypothetical protein